MKKSNLRTCIITRQKRFKQELIRFVIKDQKIYFDKFQNLQGRGYYIINDIKLLTNEKTQQILLRRFKLINIDEFITSLN